MKTETMVWSADEMAAGYDYLASAFLYGPVRLDPTVQATWGERVAKRSADLGDLWTTVTGALAHEVDEQRAMVDFHECLEVPLPGRYVAPYASVYLDKPVTLWGPTTWRVLQWYEQGELEWHRFRHVAAPDHMGVEWAFLAELSADLRPEANALRRTFIAEHVLRWVPAFLTRLESAARSPYYPALAHWGIAWIEATGTAEQGGAE
ncbi:MAG: molecular chaperone TorD family protein [Thermaerobacter sp.]|nr:molecular chaperone TorD family protein [Thermaerobacter sp.]